MKYKILNNISAVMFFMSSVSLLAIPFIDSDKNFVIFAYITAGVFWGGLGIGITMQIILAFKTKTQLKKAATRLRKTVSILFGITLFLMIPILVFLNDTDYILPINLFLVLLLAEMNFVLKRKECLK